MLKFLIFIVGFFLTTNAAPALPKVTQMVLSDNGTFSNTRYAVLTAYSATGTRNVRWETMPVNIMDKNGKAVQQTTSGKTGNFGCMDIAGIQQENGAEYLRPSGKFKYKCSNGIEEVVACKSSARAGEKWIKVGETLNVNGFWHKCESYPNMSVVYTQENACHYNQKDYHPGDEVRMGFLRLKCQDDGYKTVGCYYLDENNNEVAMEVGDKKETGKVIHFCEIKNGNLEYYNIAQGCIKNGKDYKEGQEFRQNHLRYKCENGLANILGCYVDENKDLAVNQDDIDNESHMIRRCHKNGRMVEYLEHPCGSDSTPCKPEPLSHTDEAPFLGPGLKTPGFGTFAVVQQINGNMASSSGLKLELDRILSGIRH